MTRAAAAVVVLAPRLGAVLPAPAVPLLRAGAPVLADSDLPGALRERFGAGPAGDSVAGLLLTLDATTGAAARWAAASAEVITTPQPAGAALLDAVAVMDRLRSPGGCPWDAEQTHASLMPYLIEETYELYQALEDGDRAALREELGDVLLQVLFHARLSAEATGGFDVDAVAAELVAKLVGRHPHVFTGTKSVHTASDQQVRWEELKRTEKRRESSVDGVAFGQPAVALVAKLVSRAARAGLPTDLLPAGPQPGEALFALAARAELAGEDPE
ncbi:MAG: MazG family protein, partial [Pseudonocardiaceae bacterium]